MKPLLTLAMLFPVICIGQTVSVPAANDEASAPPDPAAILELPLSRNTDLSIPRVGAPADSRFAEFQTDRTEISLEARIRTAEQELYKLYFIRDICPELEQPISIIVRDISARRAAEIVQEKLGKSFPVVCTSDATIGRIKMQDITAIEVLESIAASAGLVIVYSPDRITFEAPASEGL